MPKLFVLSVAGVRVYGRGRGHFFVLTVAAELSEFVLSVAKRGCNPASRKRISTGKENDLKGNDLKPLV